MSSTTERGLADIRAKIDLMKSQVADSYAALAELNVLPSGSAKLENLPQTIGTLAAGTLVACRLNATGSDYQLPASQADRDALLAGAKVKVRNEANEVVAEAAVPGLVNSTFFVQVPGIVAKTPVSVAVVFGNDDYTCAAIRTYLVPDRVTSCSFASKCSTGETEEVGRFQLFDDATGTSYLIRRVTRPDGTVALHYGGFYVDNTGTAVWQNHSGLYTTVKSCADASSDVVVSTVNACSDAGARNIEDVLDVLKGMKPVTATSTDATGATVVNKLMMYPKFYCKTEKTTLPIVTYNEDGSVAKTETKAVVVKWAANAKVDGSYHAHAAFVRSVRTGDGYAETELDHFFYSRYPMNWTSVHHTAGASCTVAQCTNDGLCPTTAVSRNSANEYARNLNRLACTVVDDATGETVASFAANADARAWAAASSHDIAFFQWICVLMYGVEIQTVIMGNCTAEGSNPQTTNGQTDWLFEKGVRFGSANNASNTQPCLVAGVEDGIHSSQGTFMNDLTYFAERTIDDDGTEHKRAYMAYARDRLDWTPAVSAPETLKANGYRELSFDLNSNADADATISNPRRRLGYDEGVGARDLMIMCASQTEPNFQVAAIDNFWFGATPAVGTAASSACLVALGRHRNNARSLGLFAVFAANGLGNANANCWRPRLSLQVVGV